MHDSLAWLRDPRTQPALGDLLCGLIRDIRLILMHSDAGSTAKLSAIAQAVEQLALPPGPQASVLPVAASVAALLARGTDPATALFAQLAGEPIRIELTSRLGRPLTSAECLELRVAQETQGHQRTGTLRTTRTGLVAAEVSSLIVTGRLPAPALRELGIPGPGDEAPPMTATPLGTVLARLGVHREPLGAHLLPAGVHSTSSRFLVESSARMWLDGVPVALASERVTAEFCQRARARIAGALTPGGSREAAVPGRAGLPRGRRRGSAAGLHRGKSRG